MQDDHLQANMQRKRRTEQLSLGNRSAKLDALTGVRRMHAHWFKMLLNVLTCFYMFLHVLSKKVVARFLGYISNM